MKDLKRKCLQAFCGEKNNIQCAVPSDAYQFSISLMIAFSFALLAITSLVVILYIGYYLYTPQPDIQLAYSKFLDFCKPNISPKPVENLVFLTTVLFIPLLVYLQAKGALRVMRHYSDNYFLQQYTKGMVYLFSFLMVVFSYSSGYMTNLTLVAFQQKTVLALILALTLFLCYRLSTCKPLSTRSNKKGSFVVILVVTLSIILVSMSFRVSSLYLVGDTPAWVVNFGAVFYSVTQVFAGKSILVDLPAQYGMYGELLKPVFKLIGLSVFTFTGVMELLQMTALFSIFMVLWRVIRSKLLVLICMLTFCFITGFTWLLIQTGTPEPYYQYYPIRFFFPASSVLLFYFLVKFKRLRTISLLSVVSAIAIIWNVESGIAVFGTFMAYLVSLVVFPTRTINRKKAALYVLYAGSIFFICVLLFLLYLSLKSGHALDLSLILKYQHTFYLSGFAMLPIPRKPDVWHIVIACYLLGLLGAALNWIKGKRPLRWEMIFCLSMLGIALFLYYQGRSHPNVLVIATWPAIVILFVMSDLLFDLVRRRKIPPFFTVMCLPVLSFGLLVTTEFIVSTPMLFNTMVKRWEIMLTASKETAITRNVAFIKGSLHGGEEAVILAPNQAVYYAEAHVASPIYGPGAVEILLRADLEHLKQELLSSREKLFFKRDTVGNTLDPYLKKTISTYRVLSTSKDDMTLLINGKQEKKKGT